MVQVFISSLALSVIHAVIPNHWIPLIAVGRTEGWSTRETLGATGITGLAHVMSTILIGLGVGWAGYALYSEFEWLIYTVAPAIIIVLGVIYLYLDMRHKHHHHHDLVDVEEVDRSSKIALIGTLATAMFFSPCLELESYYFAAGMYGWEAVLLVSAVYLIVTVSGMMLLVYAGLRGVERFNLDFLERHEKAITGWVLILIGVFTLVYNI